jgi:hypothetical protein
MGLGFDTPYVVSGWMLVALVILPFLFGLLYGLHVASKRFLLRLVKDMDSEKLLNLIETGEVKDGDEGFKSITP